MADNDTETPEREFEKKIEREVSKIQEHVLGKVFAVWGFAPPLERLVWNLIDVSGYMFLPERDNDAWTVKVEPTSAGKFESAKAQEALDNLEAELRFSAFAGKFHPLVFQDLEANVRFRKRAHDGGFHWYELSESDFKELESLATRLHSAASRSLQEHGDFSGAINEIKDWKLRGWNHPNAQKRADLVRLLDAYVRAGEAYDDGVNEHFERLTAGDVGWFRERLNEFECVAATYADTPNAHTRWLTSEIAAWLLRPSFDLIGYYATRPYPRYRLGAKRKTPWCAIIPMSISVLLFLSACAFVAACYLLINLLVALAAGGLCGVFFARRYIYSWDFQRERGKTARLWQRVAHLHDEVKNGSYNSGEIIRLFKQAADQDALLPSIFVSVIALPRPPM